MIRLFFCEECGWRGWTFAADPVPAHDCTADSFTLQRMDLTPAEYEFSVSKIAPKRPRRKRSAKEPVRFGSPVGVGPATDYDPTNPRNAT